MLLRAIKESTVAISFIARKAFEQKKHYPHAAKVYEDLDLMADIRVIGAIADDLKDKEEISGQHCKSINVAVDNIRETLQSLHQKMNIVDKAILDHSNRYLSSWRTFDQSIELEEIKTLHIRLLGRLKMLSRVTCIT